MPDTKPDVSNNPPGERTQATEQQPPQGAGEASPGLKDKDAKTSDSYGNTRESGETPKE